VNDWLIRTRDNSIFGPVPKEEVIRRIQTGELTPRDEVCRANHYWFTLYEKQEFVDQLGIPFPEKFLPATEEETTDVSLQTATLGEDEKKDLGLTPEAKKRLSEDIESLHQSFEQIKDANAYPGAKSSSWMIGRFIVFLALLAAIIGGLVLLLRPH